MNKTTLSTTFSNSQFFNDYKKMLAFGEEMKESLFACLESFEELRRLVARPFDTLLEDKIPFLNSKTIKQFKSLELVNSEDGDWLESIVSPETIPSDVRAKLQVSHPHPTPQV